MVGLTDLSRGDPILLNLNNYSKQIIQEKHDALVERIIESKLKKKVVMTPEQEEIVEMFRMDL